MTSAPLIPTNVNRGADNNVYAAPVWQAPGAPSCTACHGGGGTWTAMTYNAFTNRSALSDAHKQHVATDNGGYAMNCQECHAWTVGASDTAINGAAGYDNHINGAKTVKFTTVRNSAVDQSGGSINGTAQCLNIYCHSNGQTTTAPFGSPTSIAWSTPGGTNCTSCHGGAGLSTTLSTRHQKNTDNTAVTELS